MEKFPTPGNKKTIEIPTTEAIRNFYEENSWAKYEFVMRAVDMLERKDPEFLEKVWGSTKDLRETAELFSGRAIERIKKFGIELVENPETGELSTPEGVRGGKLDAPNFLTNPVGYEKYMAEQGKKTPFSGLTPEQSAAMLKSLNEFWEAKSYIHKAHDYQFQLLQGRGMIEEIKEQQGQNDVFSQLQEKLQFPYVMLRAYLDGKLAKLPHVPKFAYNKFKLAVEGFLKESE